MTQVWPVCGDAPVPTWVSMICKPDAVVVMGFPALCAVAGVGLSRVMLAPIAVAASIANVSRRVTLRIVFLLDDWLKLD
jgi:hypothetical protein